MRIVMAATPGAGHLYPLMPLAEALVGAGHQVCVATAPEALAAVRAAGVDGIDVGIDGPSAMRRAAADLGVEPAHATRADRVAIAGRAFGWVATAAVQRDLAAVIRDRRPDLVIAEIMNFGAGLAADVAGVPRLVHSYGRFPDGAELMSAVADQLHRYLESRRVDATIDHFMQGPTYLDVCPPSLQSSALRAERRVPMRPVAWNPPSAAGTDPMPVGDAPWIYLTLGTRASAVDVLNAMLRGLTALDDVRVVVASGAIDVDQVDVPTGSEGRVSVRTFVAQARLLDSPNPPRLVVHHGGSGTTLAAAAAGIPQLICPLGADQFENAAAAGSSGVATVVTDPGAHDIAGSAQRLLTSPVVRGACRDLAAEIAALPDPARVAGDIVGVRPHNPDR